MNENIWEQFAGMATADEVLKAKPEKYDDWEDGQYKLEVLEIELGVTQSAQPMVAIKFKNLETENFMKRIMYLQSNNPDRTPENIAKCQDFINLITDSEIVFDDFPQFAEEIAKAKLGKKVVVTCKHWNEDKKYPNIYYTKEYMEENNEPLPFV